MTHNLRTSVAGILKAEVPDLTELQTLLMDSTKSSGLVWGTVWQDILESGVLDGPRHLWHFNCFEEMVLNAHKFPGFFSLATISESGTSKALNSPLMRRVVRFAPFGSTWEDLDKMRNIQKDNYDERWYLGDQGMLEMLVSTPSSRLENLEELLLSDQEISYEGLSYLVGHPITKNLRVLDLGSNFQCSGLCKGELTRLIEYSDFRNLESLNLHFVDPPAPFFRAFAEAHLPKLRELNLDRSSAGMLELIANSPNLENLKTLNLSTVVAKDSEYDSYLHFLSSPYLVGLKNLELSFTFLTEELLITALENIYRLESLNLAGSLIDDEVLVHLLTLPNLQRLKTLNLKGCSVTKNLFKILSQACDSLESLDLGFIEFPEKELLDMIPELQQLNLTHLNLKGTLKTQEGILLLTKALPETKITF